jgi:hypothetical protein
VLSRLFRKDLECEQIGNVLWLETMERRGLCHGQTSAVYESHVLRPMPMKLNCKEAGEELIAIKETNGEWRPE